MIVQNQISQYLPSYVCLSLQFPLYFVCPSFQLNNPCWWPGCWVIVSAVVSTGDSPRPPHSLWQKCHGNRDKRPQLLFSFCHPGNPCQQFCRLWDKSSWHMSTVLSQQRDDQRVELTFSLTSFFFSPLILSVTGEEAHHRPVRGSEGWTQSDFPARGLIWSHSGMDVYLFHRLQRERTSEYYHIFTFHIPPSGNCWQKLFQITT